MLFLDPRQTITHLIEENPRYLHVLDRFHIDFGFAGGLTLGEVCLKQGLDLQELLGQLRESEREAAFLDDTVLESMEVPELVEYVLFTHHHFLERELPRLEDLFVQALRVAGKDRPELLEWSALFRRFHWSMERHMKKEGKRLFPHFLAAGKDIPPDAREREIRGLLEEMEREDEEGREALRRLRSSADGYQVPDGVDRPTLFLLHDLGRLESEVKQHWRVEREILFPKALVPSPPPPDPMSRTPR